MTLKLETLPSELLTNNIYSSLNNNLSEISSLVRTSKTFYALFRPKLLVDTLLRHIALGNQIAAEKMLQIAPELMITKGEVIDPSGRHFHNISPFEFVLWALDVRYIAIMLRGEDGLKIAHTLKVQYEYFETHGVSYIIK